MKNNRFKNGIVSRSLGLLDKNDRVKLYFLIFFQITLGVLDLIGVAFVGVIGALAVTGISSGTPGERVSKILELIHLENFSFETQVAIFGLLAAGFMMSKTLLSMIFTQKSLTFLSYRSAQFSAKLARKVLSQQYLEIRNTSNQGILYSLTVGANNLILGILGAVVAIISDLSLVLVMLLGLFIVDTYIAFGSLLFFSLIGFVLHNNLSNTATKLGEENAKLSIKVSESVMDILDTFRELFVRNKLNFYVNEIEKSRNKVARTTAAMAFLPYISKYVLETAVVLGALLLAATQFIYQDAGRAFGNLAIFLAAGTRIAPAILRLQQGFLQIRTSSGGATPTLNDFDRIQTSLPDEDIFRSQEFRHEGFHPHLSLKAVGFSYKKQSKFAINEINLEIPEGKMVALVGSSGAGKTTLADLILGVIKPDRGEILISGKTPKEVIVEWPGAIAYVPQDVIILSTSISRNITLDLTENFSENNKNVLNSIKTSQLESLLTDSELGTESFVGERGSKLSGGQRQRLGIARALYTNPKLIVMDEATSSLDAETEFVLNESIQKLKGSVTLIIIAHRLATVRNADIVCYIKNGAIIAKGDFEFVRNQVPDFDKQAKLLGL